MGRREAPSPALTRIPLRAIAAGSTPLRSRASQDLVARRLQRVDAQVERRTSSQGLGFFKPVFVEIFFKGRLHPFRDIALHMQRRVVERAASKGGHHVGSQRLRRELVAFQLCCQLLWRNAPLTEHDGMAERRGAVAVHQIGMREFHPQRVIDDIADRGTIAGSGKPMGQPPILEGIGHGTLARFDIGENLNSSGEPATQSHLQTPFSAVVAVMAVKSKPGGAKRVTNADQMGGCFHTGGRALPLERYQIHPEQIPDGRVVVPSADDAITDAGGAGADHADMGSGGLGRRSRTRPRMNGPRSLMRTTTVLPLRLLVTATLVPNLRLRCAAVRWLAFIRSPDAVPR